MRTTLSRYLPQIILILVVVLSVGLVFWDAPFMYVQTFMTDNIVLGSILFVLLLVGATVFAPVTVMPIIPAIAVIIGPFFTAVLSIVGWTLGGVIAFLIARYCGRPILEKFVSYENIKKYENLVPEHAQFLTIVLLRTLIPVDILSYVLGATLSVSLLKYTLATVIGVTWFSFAFAYLGNAFYTNDIKLISILGILSLAILFLGWYLLNRRKNQNTE